MFTLQMCNPERDGCVIKSLTSVRSWSDNLFISGGNLHLTNQFCGVVLDSTTISNKNSLNIHFLTR
ncbi:hypothetical protein MTR_7g081640 [Medicago truncatula]|uniref:Uncharacterized protein n=1 Tax=Medicago truncatula TaxID=3880 RepID=G7KTG4_MEDTR|nr:hypothetical protein MTR_7g081640 [Medicago truncatula]